MSSTYINEYMLRLKDMMRGPYTLHPSERDEQNIKRGLRNADGTGVLLGVTKIGSVQGYTIQDGERMPAPGHLYYRGISVEDIVESHRKNKTFGFSEVVFQLLVGKLPTETQLKEFETMMAQARQLLARVSLADIPFSDALPLAPLHWLIADQSGAIVAEPLAGGLKIHENPVGVLTNEPPFDYQMFHLNNHMQLTREAPRSSFAEGLELRPYCLGMGAMGLPGDLSSASRFVRAAFTRLNSVSGPSEEESVSQFFHILGSVAQTRGCARAGEDRYEITVYSSCCSMDRGVYYYTTYENSQISAVDLHREDLDGAALAVYPLRRAPAISFQN